MKTRSPKSLPVQLGVAGVLLAIVALYASSLHFGFIWDDPIWYERVAQQPLGSLLGPQPDFQFYRPMTLALTRAFARPNGTFPALEMHAFQIGVHLIVTVLAAQLARRLGFCRPAELPTFAALFGLYPLSHQAIVWTQAQQPWVIAATLVTLHLYLSARRRRSPMLLGLSLVAYICTNGFHENGLQTAAFVFLIEVQRHRNLRRALRSAGPWAFALIGSAYLALWISMPKAGGITSIAFEPLAARYLSQGLLYPLLPDPLRLPYWLALVGMVGLLGAVLRASRDMWWAIWGLGWVIGQLFTAWAGLRYDYIALSWRFFYLSAFGVTLIWFGAFRSLWADYRGWPLRALGYLGLLLIVVQGVALIARANALYTDGTTALAQAISVMADHGGDARLLFVNFPDRYEPKNPFYPIGYWGVTLAPVVTELGEFAALNTGVAPDTDNWTVPSIDWHAREAGPYVIDMRGGFVSEASVYESALGAEAIYLTEHSPEGRMALRYSGTVTPGNDTGSQPALARFGDLAALLAIKVKAVKGGLDLELRWQALQTGKPTETVFVHLLSPEGALLAQADGGPGRELLPLWAWRPGDVIVDPRLLVVDGGELAPGAYGIAVGIYNWDIDQRVPAIGADGRLLLDDQFVVTGIEIP